MKNQSVLANLGHYLSVRRARIEEQNTPIAIITKKLEREALNQRLQAEMADAEYFESLHQSPAPVTRLTVSSKKATVTTRLAQLFAGIF